MNLLFNEKENKRTKAGNYYWEVLFSDCGFLSC